ncbi:MAG: V-type ATPase subunit [Spirochaetales bacterium]|nr:V-type ATPase subunit [Spirochaetales bacterium]
MSSVDTYGFINAKMRARLGKAREEAVTEALLRAPTLVDAIAALRPTRYAALARSYDQSGDIQAIELVLLKMEIALHREISGYLDGAEGRFIAELLGKIEIDNLKNTIRLWYSSIIHRRPIRHRSEYLFKEEILHPVDWTALINALSWDGVVQATENTPCHSILLEHAEESLREDGLFHLESRLDRLWYEEIRRATSLLKKPDREKALELLDQEIDLKNLLILVRYGWHHRLEAKELFSLLLPWGEVFESREAGLYIETPKENRSANELLSRFLPDEQRIGDHSAIEEVLRIEELLARNRRRAYRRLLGGDPFNIGVALAYFFLNKEESRRIKAILNGKYYGFDEGYIRGVIG